MSKPTAKKKKKITWLTHPELDIKMERKKKKLSRYQSCQVLKITWYIKYITSPIDILVSCILKIFCFDFIEVQSFV